MIGKSQCKGLRGDDVLLFIGVRRNELASIADVYEGLSISHLASM